MTTEARKFPEPQPFTEKTRPTIALQPVESSQVKAVGYDEASKTLAVQFKHGAGAVYHYGGVSPELHQAFISAESMGKFHGQHIKPLAFEKFLPDMEPTEADGPQAAVQGAADGLVQTPLEA